MNQQTISNQALDEPHASKNQVTPFAQSSFFSPRAFSNISHRLLVAYSFVAALSIALSQIILGALFLYWLGYLKAAHQARKQNGEEFAFSPSFPLQGPAAFIAAPVAAFTASSLLSSVFGMSPHKGLFAALTTSLNYTLPFVIVTSMTCVHRTSVQVLPRCRDYLWAFALGQGLAAIHTVISGMLGHEIQPGIPGAVTESGQLVLILAGVSGLVFLLSSAANPLFRLAETGAQRGVGDFGSILRMAASAGLMFVCLVIAAWPGIIASSTLSFIIRPVVLLLAIAVPFITIVGTSVDITRKIRWRLLSQDPRCAWFIGSLLFAALVLNLKRGPWLGVLLELSILGILLSRRLLWTSITAAFLLIFAVGPARTRLFHLVDDFVIDGGRKNMWELGTELVQRFPLGVGFHNAKFMRELDPSLPELHRHMHNNLLNVTVESGWIGLACYLWWMLAIFQLGFVVWHKTKTSRAASISQLGVLVLTCTCGLIGWQAAGIVEYNFGDGEVRLIALFFMGLVLSIAQHLYLQDEAQVQI